MDHQSDMTWKTSFFFLKEVTMQVYNETQQKESTEKQLYILSLYTSHPVSLYICKPIEEF